MRFEAKIDLDLNIPELKKATEEATRLGMRDVTVQIHAEAIDRAPPWDHPHPTGTNRRSIAAEVSGMGLVATGGEGKAERVVDEGKIQGAVYSTSGYGGYLEVGTITPKRVARPYLAPARDKFYTESNLGNAIKRHMK